MKEFLKGNDISLTWTLPVATAPVSYTFGELYVYGGTCRYNVDVTVAGNQLRATIGGELLPTGFYSLEYLYTYLDGGKNVHRRIKKSLCFAITEDEEDNTFELELN